MRFLRTNTAVIIAVGPFYDKTDGVTPETALTITNERISLTAETDAGSAPTYVLDNVTGATSGTANDLNYITGGDNAMMQLELAAADVNRLGRMFLTITDAANHVPVFHEFMVMPALVYDTFFASSGGATFPAATLASTTNITAGTVTTATNVTTVNGLAANVITAAATAADFGTEVASAVWDMDATGHQTQGTFGQAIGDPVADTNTIFKAVVTDATGATVGADAAAILDDTGTSGVVSVTGAVGSVTGNVGGNVTGTVGSVVGAVGSVTGNVGGNVTGTVGSVVGAVGSVTGNVGGNVTGTIGGMTAAALKDFFDTDSTTTYASAVAGSVVKEIADNAAGGGLDAAGVRAAVGLASANLDTQLSTIDDFLDTEVTAIKAKTDLIPAAPAAVGDIPTAAQNATAVLTTAMTEAYSTDGGTMTLAQSSYMVWSFLAEKGIVGTTMTAKKLDGSTAAMTFTLDSDTAPTSITRAS